MSDAIEGGTDRVSAKRPDYLKPHSFWSRPSTWPDDGDGETFMARAIDRLGRAKFGEDWVGLKFAGKPRPFPNPEDRQFATQSQVVEAARRIRDRDKDAWRAGPGELRDLMKRLSNDDEDIDPSEVARAASLITAEQWEWAEEQIDSQLRDAPDPAKQWPSLLTELRRHLVSGRLESFVRDVKGGAIRPFPKENWNTETWRPRFRACRVDEQDPFSRTAIDYDSKSGSYLFVSKSGLQMLLEHQLGGVPSGRLEYEPPLVALLLAACRVLRISDAYCPPPSVIRTTLREIWKQKMPTADPMSENLERRLMAMLWFPRTDNGRGQK